VSDARVEKCTPIQSRLYVFYKRVLSGFASLIADKYILAHTNPLSQS
jgi:hypothetical protein